MTSVPVVDAAPEYWLLGDPVAHSLSPRFQNAALRASGLAATYRTRHTTGPGLGSAVAEIRAGRAAGANVTLPHKRAVRDWLDSVDPLAAAAGAVNTIVRDTADPTAPKLRGYNTDVTGLERALRDWLGGTPASVLLLGAGGAARGALLALDRLGVSRVVVHNRTRSAAAQLTRIRTGCAVEVGLTPCDLVIHATSLGVGATAGSAEFEAAARVWADLPWGTAAYDLSYRSTGQTPFLAAAAARGVRQLEGGLGMLVHQGADAFELWTGKTAPRDIMFAALQ